MNGYNYQSTGMANNQLPQLTPLSNLSTRPYQQDSPGPSATLPPLHTQTNPSSFGGNGYRSNPQTPRSPQASALSAPSHRTTSLSQIAPQPSYSTQQSNPYTPIAPNYSSGPSPNFGATANPNANGSGLSGQYGSMTLPQPPFFESAHGQNPPFPLNGHYQSPAQQNDGKNGQQRVMPVVGSQGRRGILPSANGSRVPPLGGTIEGSANARLTPMKGPDGKYSCQYCNKVYLHLKHLKRHHLRHTGERPYQCCLCRETFCRSDILKRHFQKCSLRRGNPTGANHLTHAQAHLGRPSNPTAGLTPGGPTTQGNGAASTTNPALYRTSWQNGAGAPPPQGQEQGNHVGQTLESNVSSRSNSIIRPGSDSTDDKKRFSGPSNLNSLNNSIDTSPTSSGALSQNGDRKGMPYPSQMKHDHQPPSTTAYQAPQSSNYYSQQSAPAPYHPTSQADSFPNYNYNAPNGYRPYPPTQYEGMSGEPLPYFQQAAAHDPVIYSHP